MKKLTKITIPLISSLVFMLPPMIILSSCSTSDEVTIKLEYDGGIDKEGRTEFSFKTNSSKFYSELDLPILEKENCTFKYFYIKDDSMKRDVRTLQGKINRDRTLVALFEQTKLIVNLELLGGSGSTFVLDVPAGTNALEFLNSEKVTKPTKTGFKFKQWLKPDLTPISSTDTITKGNNNFVAQWETDGTTDTFNINYDINGGSGGPKYTTIPFAKNTTINSIIQSTGLNYPTKQDEEFDCWRINDNEVFDSDKLTSDTTLKASWITPTTETANDFINDRSFSLIKTVTDGSVVSTVSGTAWILSDATLSSATDYSYYLATTWHTRNSFESDKYKTESIKYADASLGTESKIKLSQYLDFNTAVWEDQDQFHSEGQTEAGYYTCIDMAVLKVDFGTASDLESKAPGIKSKLDKLNQKQTEKKHINHITKFNDNMRQITEFYIGGYIPVTDSNSEYYSTFKSQKVKNISYRAPSVDTHHIGPSDSEYNKYLDVTPQYYFQIENNLNTNGDRVEYLSSIPAGSMLIGKYKGEWQILGQYWGYYYDSASPKYQFPHFSIIRSTVKDYVEPYIKV